MNTDVLAALTLCQVVPTMFGTFLPPVAVVRAQADRDGCQRDALTQAILVSGGLVLVTAAATRSRAVALVGLVVVGAQAAAYTAALPLGR